MAKTLLNNIKEEFLINELTQSSIHSGFQTRNHDFPIYNYERLSLHQAKKLRKDIHHFLLSYLIEFNKTSELEHFTKIERLSKEISYKYGNILHNNRFRIGVSQKIINLFLKHMWIIKKINEPYHCPIDNIIKQKVLKGIKDEGLIDWTEMDKIKDYKRYIELTRIKATESGLSIACWELINWKNR